MRATREGALDLEVDPWQGLSDALQKGEGMR
jgi:hypothetical protein